MSDAPPAFPDPSARSPRTRPFVYYDAVTSICSRCLRRVEGRIELHDDRVMMDKWCPLHGRERVLLSDDPDYYRRCREVYLKRPELPRRFQTPTRWGCPYDCGLCPEHMQHSCLSIVELTDRCNLECPICYAGSGPQAGRHRTLAEIEAMLDAIVASEGEPDVVQLSGGEPTLHPELWAVLDACKARPIQHLMLNTNGIRLAREPGFARRLAAYAPGFEVYLQWDSMREGPLRSLRGLDLREDRRRALDALDEAGLSTTLVVTVKRGCNDDELGEIVDFALGRPCVRGVTLQPVQVAGRTEGFDPARDRITLSEVRRRVAEQSSVFRLADLVPVPCNPDGLAMAYALKLGGRVTPLTGLFPPEVFLQGSASTIVFEWDPTLREQVWRLFSTGHSPEAQAGCLSDLLCCLPQVQGPPELGYQNVFRLIIMQFLDAHSFDLRAVRRSCVHIADPAGRLVPFDTHNLFYRGSAAERLARLRSELDRAQDEQRAADEGSPSTAVDG